MVYSSLLQIVSIIDSCRAWSEHMSNASATRSSCTVSARSRSYSHSSALYSQRTSFSATIVRIPTIVDRYFNTSPHRCFRRKSIAMRINRYNSRTIRLRSPFNNSNNHNDNIHHRRNRNSPTIVSRHRPSTTRNRLCIRQLCRRNSI